MLTIEYLTPLLKNKRTPILDPTALQRQDRYVNKIPNMSVSSKFMRNFNFIP